MVLTVAGTVLPGLGLIAAKRRVVGTVVLGLFGLTLLSLGVWALVDLKSLLSIAVRPTVLHTLTVLLVLAAVVWVGVVIGSHLALRPARPTAAQRVTGSVLVGFLAFAVAAPMAVAARYSYDQAGLVSTVFQSGKKSKSATRPTFAPPSNRKEDPWKGKPRVNVLLLGGDSGPDRTGTRTDTVILASIDTSTGDTTLFSLPRNTARMPFPADSPLHRYYPHGFTDGNGENAEFFLNAIYQNVPANVPPDVLGSTDNLGADALKLSVGTALGLKVDYYMLINLKGFKQMINALGGIRLNVNTYIPIGGSIDHGVLPSGYLKPGKNQLLDGEHALWYARSRWGSDDYARMDRQRCVINAMIQQANPANVLARYEAIAKAGKDIIRTDIPQEMLPMMVELSLRVKDGNVRSIVFRHGSQGFFSNRPDFALMRQRVKAAIGEAKKAPTPKPSSAPTQSASGRSAKPRKSATTPASEDVTDSCAWRPEIAATAQPPQTR
nr:LCP family protein [Microlunatus panaciterrae]